MPESLPERSPEIWRKACRQMALRAAGGVVAYPALVALLGPASGLSRTAPATFTILVTFVILASIGRQILIRRFDAIWDRSPGLWQAGFFGGLLGICSVIGGLLGYFIHQSGVTELSMFALAVSAGLAALVVFTYAPALNVVRLLVALLFIPASVVLLQSGRHPEPWIAGVILISAIYMLWVAQQQYRERWEGLATSDRLARHASDLEQAQADLRHARDELERLVAERTRELERTSQDYRQIFESAHDAIVILRPEDEQVLNVNRRACEVYGFTREEFLRLSIKTLSENVARGQRQLRETLERGVYNKFDSIHRRKDGSRMFLEINASVIEYEGQLAILSINRDVTDRRRAEELRLAKEAAEHAAQAKTQFLANMSHEIRTPMAGILGLSDLLLKTDLDERQAEYARLVQSSAGSLLQVIDDILDFSKIEAGKLTLEEVAFDLRALLREVVELLRLSALAKGTSLELQVADDLPSWVRGDPGRLRQVLLNVVGNAVKFTEEGSVSVRARTSISGRVHIQVQDTGIGIPIEAQGRLFELFSQADSSTSRRFGGTGLGLAISKRIVEAMGGEIGVESTPGKGSTFWITVSLGSAASPVETESLTGRSVRSRRILTAEDNPISQIVITEHLKALGHEVTGVGNGLEVLAALESASYDLVLMDCQMPHLDGYEATQRIRQLPGAAARLPIIALTAHAIREELDKCLAVGMNDYITKPFREEVLRRKLELWLDSEPEAVPAKTVPDPSEIFDRTFDELQLARLRALGQQSGPEFLPKLVDQFRGRTYMDDLRRALDREDRNALQGCAHALKGSSALLGATRLSQLCARLELIALAEPREACLDQLDLIAAEHRRVLQGLPVVLQTVPAERPREV